MNGDCGARASSSMSMRAHAVTWDKRGFLERVPCAWGATTRGVGFGANFVGCIVLEAESGLVVARFLCSRRLRLPVAPVLLSNVVRDVDGKGENWTLFGAAGAMKSTLRGGSGLCAWRGWGSTLRGATGFLSASVRRVGASSEKMVWGGLATVVRTRVNCSSASCKLSVSGAKVEPGDGFLRACMMSPMPARIRSFEDAIGIVTLVGNHTSVSQMREARVSHNHTV